MKSLIVLISLIYSAYTSAQSTPISFNIKDLKPKPITVDGIKGVWFTPEDADKILQFFEVKLPNLNKIIDYQEQQIVVLQNATDKYKLSNQALIELSDTRKKMVDEALKAIKPEEVDSWYKSKELTFILGTITGAAVIFGSTYISIKTLNNAK